MKKLALAITLALGTLVQPALGNPDAIDGSWRLVAWKQGTERTNLPPDFRMLLHFDKEAWKWTADMTQRGQTKQEAGSWSFDRNTIVMKQGDRERRLVVSSTGDTLTLAPEDNPKLRLVAIRAAQGR